MTTPANTPRPTRLPGGMTTDPPYGPMADIGATNPFFYHRDFDDFNFLSTSEWTVTSASTGGVAHVAGDGGLITFTTAATLADIEVLQRPHAAFTLPQGTLLGKKASFICRLQLSDITASGFWAGLINAATTLAGIADGLYFTKAYGGTVLNLVSIIGGVATTLAIPVAAYTFVNATNIDLGFDITRTGNVRAFVGSQLVGWIPQSGTGALNTGNYPALPVVGPVARMIAPTLTAANLSPTLIVEAGAAAVKTMTADFIGAFKER